MAVDEHKAREAEQLLAQHYLDGAILARQVSMAALEQALEQARNGELRDPAKTAMNAAITSGTLLDKRLVLQERPTMHIGHTDPNASVNALARRIGLVIDATATELPIPELPEPKPAPAKAPEATEMPLPSASRPAKPRARARKQAAKKPAD
jgi:hypothetical protein